MTNKQILLSVIIPIFGGIIFAGLAIICMENSNNELEMSPAVSSFQIDWERLTINSKMFAFCSFISFFLTIFLPFLMDRREQQIRESKLGSIKIVE